MTVTIKLDREWAASRHWASGFAERAIEEANGRFIRLDCSGVEDISTSAVQEIEARLEAHPHAWINHNADVAEVLVLVHRHRRDGGSPVFSEPDR